MLLNVNEAQFIENPDAREIESAIDSLGGDEFAVLSIADHFYMQTYRTEDGAFELEYRAGSQAEHYAVVGVCLVASDVAQAMVDYASNGETWKTTWRWERMQFAHENASDDELESCYLINGEEFERIAVGDEQFATITENHQCRECGVTVGQYHVSGCESEECPCCHSAFVYCDCD